MSKTWEKLVLKNNQNRNDNKPNKKCCITNEYGKYKLRKNGILFKNIYSFSDIAYFLKDTSNYISNLSIIKNKSFMSIYSMEKDFYDVYRICKDVLSRFDIKSLQIIKVEDIDNYIAKLVLNGNLVYKLFVGPLESFMLLNVDNNLILVSDLIFTEIKSVRELDAEKIYINNIKLRKGQDLYRYFSDLTRTKVIELNNFDTRTVKNFTCLFSGCVSLEKISLEKIRTDNACYFQNMFASCHNLQTLDLNGFNVEHVIKYNDMFLDCFKLKTLKIDSWNINKNANFTNMFTGCDLLDSSILKRFENSECLL